MKQENTTTKLLITQNNTTTRWMKDNLYKNQGTVIVGDQTVERVCRDLLVSVTWTSKVLVILKVRIKVTQVNLNHPYKK